MVTRKQRGLEAETFQAVEEQVDNVKVQAMDINTYIIQGTERNPGWWEDI
jgi:hypothetical protein